MPGAWLTAIARAITTRESFEHLAGPAIADLQYDTAARHGIHWRAYAAVWLTLGAAIAQDFHVDALATLDRRTVRRMLKVSAWIILLLVFAPRLWAMVETGFDRGAELAFSIASIPSAIAAIVPVLMLPLASVVGGRQHGRAILLLALVAAVLALALQSAVIPRLQRAWATSAFRATAAADLRGGVAQRETIAEYVQSGITGQPFGPVFLDEPYPERRQVERVHSRAAIVAALAFALCGSAVRLRRDWTIVAVTLPVYLAWVWVSVFALVWMSGFGFHPVFRGSLPTLAVFAFGGAAAAMRLVLEGRGLIAGVRS